MLSHDCCGENLSLDDLVQFNPTAVEINGKVEVGIKVVHICDGMETCTVGYLP